MMMATWVMGSGRLSEGWRAKSGESEEPGAVGIVVFNWKKQAVVDIGDRSSNR